MHTPWCRVRASRFLLPRRLLILFSENCGDSCSFLRTFCSCSFLFSFVELHPHHFRKQHVVFPSILQEPKSFGTRPSLAVSPSAISLYFASLSLVIHSRIYGGQLLILTPFDSCIARSFTASPSTKRTSLRSKVNGPLSCSSDVLSVFTSSPVIRPLTRKTTPSSPIAWRWILQVTVNASEASCVSSAL